MKKQIKQVCIRIPVRLKDELQRVAEKHYISVSQYVRKVIIKAVKKENL